MADAVAVLSGISYHGLQSNRVRVGTAPVGEGPPDDAGSVPTPGTIAPPPPQPAITAGAPPTSQKQMIIAPAGSAAPPVGPPPPLPRPHPGAKLLRGFYNARAPPPPPAPRARPRP